MALVHSLWTKPMLNKERGVSLKKHLQTTIWCHALSVAYAKRSGEPIVLYTDELGRKLLSYLPYRQIYDINIPKETPSELWAAGKFFALKQMRLGDIHIDGDVFLKKLSLIRLLNKSLSENDLIVQNIEDTVGSEWYSECRSIAKHFDLHPIYNCTNAFSHAYNCGVVGLNSQDLKDKYLESYFSSLHQVQNRPEVIAAVRHSNCCVMDLLFEQQHLYEISEGYKCFCLLGRGEDAYNRAKELGYQHVLGSCKWDLLRKIKHELKMADPEIYHMTKTKLKYVLKSL